MRELSKLSQENQRKEESLPFMAEACDPPCILKYLGTLW